MKSEESNEINILKLYLRELDDEVSIEKSLDVNPIFKKIFKLEDQFSRTLRSFKEGRDVYRQFCHYILVEVADLREARTFFRERMSSFMPKVNKALSRSKMKEIYKLHVNYSFCAFAMRRIKNEEELTGSSEITKLSKLMLEMKNLRDQIITHHLYLALNKAKVFHSKNRSSSLEFSDFIQCSNEALMVSVDKFVLDENEHHFHQVAMGRMISHLLTMQTAHYSAATLGSHGQKKLASLRKTLHEMNGNVKIPELSRVLHIAEQDISDLMNSTRYFSMDAPVSEDGGSLNSDVVDLQGEGVLSPELMIENAQLGANMIEFYKTLNILERKILVLKGVMPYEDHEQLSGSEAI